MHKSFDEKTKIAVRYQFSQLVSVAERLNLEFLFFLI